VGYFHHSAQANEPLIVDFVLAEEVLFITEIAQKPAQLPQCSRRAPEAANDRLLGRFPGGDHRKAQAV
jgi:hypothetical protein